MIQLLLFIVFFMDLYFAGLAFEREELPKAMVFIGLAILAGILFTLEAIKSGYISPK